MKKYLTVIVVIVVALTMAWVTFGQEQGQGRGAGGATRAGGRGGFMTAEEQQKMFQVIEQQLGKLKAAMQTSPLAQGRSFQDMSEEERTQLREKFTKIRQEQQAAIGTILAQLARLQGRMQPPAEGEQFIIVSTADIKAVQELATKEKATETADRLARLAGPRGFGARGTGQPGTPGQGGTRQRPQRGGGAAGGQP
jgi:hypothetical protein